MISLARKNHSKALLGANADDITPSMFGYADDWEPKSREEAA